MDVLNRVIYAIIYLVILVVLWFCLYKIYSTSRTISESYNRETDILIEKQGEDKGAL